MRTPIFLALALAISPHPAASIGVGRGAALPVGWFAAEAPPSLSAGPHLFIDDRLVESERGVRRRPEPPERLSAPVVTGPEDRCFQPYVTVVRDEETGRFRIWYGVPESSSQSHVGTMESEDGIRWIRPHRVLADPLPIQFGVSIIDEGPRFPDPSKRYKYGWYGGGGLCVAASPDGLSWKPLAPGAVLPHDHDIDSIAWDPIRKRYIAMVSSYSSGPTWTGRRRFTKTSVSDDLLRWREPRPAFTPDAKDEGETQFYCMAGTITRGDLLVGLLKVLRDDLPADPGGPVAGIGYTVLAWSRDGERWERDREPFLERNPVPGSWDHAMTWGDCQVVVGDETFVYYGGYARGHKVERFRERQIGLARMPRDRYVAREAGKEGGTLRTVAVTLPPGAEMTVNAKVSGEVRVRVLDAQGRPIPGYDLAECAAVAGDSIRHPVRWKEPLERLAGRPVRLEFHLEEARLYGFDLAAKR